jgi:multidrug efflux pump subunit AcrB
MLIADESDRATIADIRNLVINDPQTGTQAGGTAGNQTGARNQNQSRGQNQNQNRAGASSRQAPAANTGRNAAPGRQGSATTSQAQQQPQRTAPIRLGAVAEVIVARGPSEIRRIRSQRAAIVSANVVGRDLQGASHEIRAALEELRGELVNTVMTLGGQNEEFERSYNSLLFAFALAVFLVYLVMASQFESLIHPFVILFAVPFAIVGVVL